MPTHSLLPFVDSPDGLLQDILISNNAGIPGPSFSMTPQSACTAKAVLQSEDSVQLSCMFCDQVFTHQDELGPHVLTHHPTTFYEPTVLRVDAEFRVPGERSRPKPSVLPTQEEAAAPSCIVCGQVAQDASELEAHMRKHKDYFTYCCNVCGRRFRESWFLKNHMKMHVKPGPKSRAVLDQEAPFTINDITQEPSSEPFLSVYKMCMVCGFFFPDHDSLAEHSKVHNREAELGKDEGKEKIDGATEAPKQEAFLHGLNLQPASENKSLNNARSSKWIPQLDPFTTYQAWQLATKGKIAVGPNNTKDIGQELSTDNEDCGSDKEEMSVIWSEGQGDKTVKELRSQPQSGTETSNPPRRSLMQKHKDKERPTTCEECHKTFRTYHQLVLHSRVHKRERGGEDSPTSADVKTPRTVSQDPAEEAHEEALEENLISGEDGLDRSKYRSKECSYCGKSFRSSYYLTVHMRTHTGEKPYKCVYCNYAAAQKTSLKYHYHRRHKDKPYLESSSRSGPLLPSPDGSPAPSRPKLWDSKANGTPKVRFDGLDIKPDKHIVQLNTEGNDVQVEQPLVVNLKKEKEERNENSEGPLNLSLKVSVSIAAEARCALIPNSCSLCTYKTLYPEVLVMHKRLMHKDKSDKTKKNEYGCSVKRRRYTGCPPALEGKDVTPLQMTDRRHPRRTKSPLPQPSKPPEALPVNQPHGPKCSPVPAPGRDIKSGFQPYRQNVETHPNQESSKYTEVMRKTNAGSKYVADRSASLDRMGVSERSYPSRSGALWHSDAARLCLSSRFGSLPQVDFGNPSGKRLKISVPTNRVTETGGEKVSFRPPPLDGPSRLLFPGRNASQGPGPSSSSEALCPIKTGSAALGGSLESEWNMMNFLHYTPNDLASLYHSTPTNPSHGGLANPRVGARTLLFQPLPNLPSLPRRDPSTSFPHQCYGTTDKNS